MKTDLILIVTGVSVNKSHSLTYTRRRHTRRAVTPITDQTENKFSFEYPAALENNMASRLSNYT